MYLQRIESNIKDLQDVCMGYFRTSRSYNRHIINFKLHSKTNSMV